MQQEKWKKINWITTSVCPSQGDSGGPLSVQAPRQEDATICEHTVAGVVSFGVGTGAAPCGRLGVYIRVSSYLDWITGYIAPGTT